MNLGEMQFGVMPECGTISAIFILRQLQDSKFKYRTCATQETDIAEDCQGIELNGWSLEIVWKFCYLVDSIGDRGGAFDSPIPRIRSGWCKVRDLVSLLASRGLSLGAKGRLYFACVLIVMLHGIEVCHLKTKKWLDWRGMMQGWLDENHEDRIFALGLRNRLKLKSMRECLQGKRLQWFGHLKRMKESAWSSKRSNVVPSRLVVVSLDKVSKDIAKDRNG